jgi:hypothetical protein
MMQIVRNVRSAGRLPEVAADECLSQQDRFSQQIPHFDIRAATKVFTNGAEQV